MNISGVYKIQSIAIPERVYIGSSKNMYKREEVHFRQLRNNKHHSVKLQRHFNKYGEEDLKFVDLMECDKDVLLRKEQCYINIFQPYFNGTKIAKSPVEFKLSEESRKKISESQTGDKNPNYGKKLSDETKTKISLSKKGKSTRSRGFKLTDETKRKLSIAKTGKSNPHKGYPVSEETRLKLSIANRGRTPWNKGIPMKEESRIRLKQSMTGNKHPHKGIVHSEETRKKMSIARSNYYKNKKRTSTN